MQLGSARCACFGNETRSKQLNQLRLMTHCRPCSTKAARSKQRLWISWQIFMVLIWFRSLAATTSQVSAVLR